ncbi:hypothetical protein [Streptomyces sp. NPDC016845]|uniref:hypothetical protein n=1 Tax=Streptomyces sp. NPDC016845 TaxID=3364972 RepID=UPI0037B54EAA
MTSETLEHRGPVRWTAPVLVNLLLGLPALAPLGCAWWLLSEWLPMDCRSVEESYAPGFTGSCNYETLDNGPVLMGLGAVSGLVVLALVVLANRGFARRADIGRSVWTRAVPFVLLPFAVLWALLL